MSTVARPHSTGLQVLKGAQLSVHGTAQRVHMGHGAARSVDAWMLLCASQQGRENAKPLLSRRCCSNEDRATRSATGNCGSKMPHFTQSWGKEKKGAAGLAGTGQCCLGAEGPQTPNEAPTAGSGSGERRVFRCRQRESDTAAAGDAPHGRAPVAGGTGEPGHSRLSPGCTHPGWHSVPHGPGLLQAHPAELWAAISGCSSRIVSDPTTRLTWH